MQAPTRWMQASAHECPKLCSGSSTWCGYLGQETTWQERTPGPAHQVPAVVQQMPLAAQELGLGVHISPLTPLWNLRHWGFSNFSHNQVLLGRTVAPRHSAVDIPRQGPAASRRRSATPTDSTSPTSPLKWFMMNSNTSYRYRKIIVCTYCYQWYPCEEVPSFVVVWLSGKAFHNIAANCSVLYIE